MPFPTHLECSAHCGAPDLDARKVAFLCGCGAPLLARYDLAAVRASVRPTDLIGRVASMWRYREVLPLDPGEEPVTLGEGFTPLLAAPRLAATLGVGELLIKDEALNPTQSFKARGMAVAVTRARALGARVLSVPSAGNAGDALAAYAAAAGLEARVFMPRDAKAAFVDEARLLGARVELVDGLITDCARVAAEQGAGQGWYDVATLREPWRLEGKKTLGYELAEQLGWVLPDVIIYPTGGGTGLVGMWKAFAELEELGWIAAGQRPRMVVVQASGCAPMVRAFETGAARAVPWENAHTAADGLRVPRAVGDRLILTAIRESGGTAVAVSDHDLLEATLELSRATGIGAAPEGGACLAALRRLIARGDVAASDRVVLFNTGGPLKYLDAWTFAD